MFPTIDKQCTGERIRKLMKQQNITVKQIQEYLRFQWITLSVATESIKEPEILVILTPG